MRSSVLLLSFSAIFLLAALTRSQETPKVQDPQPVTSEAVLLRLEILEKQVAHMQAWIQAQAKQAESLSTALDAVEKEGFIAGINPLSREILLAAFRQQALMLRVAVPGAPISTDAEPGTATDGVTTEAEKERNDARKRGR